MVINEKLIKQIYETKYLNAENSWRYRPIMRLFYFHYEKLEYWLYKEDVYNELKENDLFQEYTIEECERDLATLVDWYSLTKMQDTKNATSIEEFKNKKFRYQLTEYATEIERLMISLEEMEIKTSSLEPKLFDRLRMTITRLEEVDILSDDDVNEIWNNLNTDFNKLNENYQDFLKKFNDPESDELLQNELFLQFKTENIHFINASIAKIDDEKINIMLNKLNNYYKHNPMFLQNFNFEHFKDINLGKIKNIFKWFIGTKTSVSEGEKLIDTTSDIIVKITKYANVLIELHGNMTSRKEEYKHLCKTFDNLQSIDDAHKLASVVIGISNVRHFIGNSNINTDTIINTYDNPPIEIVLSSRTKLKKERSLVKPIVDKSEEKRKILLEYREEQEKNKQILKKLIKDKKIILKDKIILSKIERRYIQKLLAVSSLKKETEFGLSYNIIKEKGQCQINSPDGIFYMDSLVIEFKGEI